MLTIMRAELIAIHTTLARFHDHSWLEIFIDSLSSLHAIRLHYINPSGGGLPEGMEIGEGGYPGET